MYNAAMISSILLLHNYRKRQKFRGWKVSWFAGFIRYAGKSFAIFSITTFIHSWFSKTATSVSTKTSHSSGEFSLKLSLAYSQMDESTLLTHVCANFTLSRMTMKSQKEKSYSGIESEMKQIRALTTSLLASSASYFLISWQKPSRFFATTMEYFLEYFKIYSWSQLSEEQKFSRENFCGLLKIRKNRESFLTVKFLLFTVHWKVITNKPRSLSLYSFYFLNLIKCIQQPKTRACSRIGLTNIK